MEQNRYAAEQKCGKLLFSGLKRVTITPRARTQNQNATSQPQY
jgi:hypothetical protein